MSRSICVTGLGLALVLGACSSNLSGTSGGTAGLVGDGACGATERQGLVGQSFTVLNDADLPEDARVLFPGAAVTDEFAPGRLNITVGTDDLVTRVYCG